MSNQRRSPMRFGLRSWLHLAVFALFLVDRLPVWAVTLTNNARIEITDPNDDLSWKPSVNALTVSCWFKLSIPSDADIKENMVIIANRLNGSQSDPHAYWVQFNPLTANVEFTSKGSGGTYTKSLIERPYLDRWYHVAIVRQGDVFTTLIDGRPVSGGSGFAGDASGGNGVSVGGLGSGQYLYGEVQELAIYQSALDRYVILDHMFADQILDDPSFNLRGYFKLGYATNAVDKLRNFAPRGNATASAKGSLGFEETNQAGEQSAYDSRRNGGRDALTPLSGAFAWSQVAFARPSPGIPFSFQIGYSSGTMSDPFGESNLGVGWRHSFDVRIVPSVLFLPEVGNINSIGLMTWQGAIETWDANLVEGLSDGTYRTRHNEYRGELYVTNNVIEWRTPDRFVFRFRHPASTPLALAGKLLEIRDFNSNVVKILRNSTSGVITQIVDSARASYDFRYDARNLLTNVTFGGWNLRFEHDQNKLLTNKFLVGPVEYAPVNTSWQFAYYTNGTSSNLLQQIIDPRGYTNTTVVYDKYGRQTNQVDGLHRTNQTAYLATKREIRRIDPAAKQWVEKYDRKGHITERIDPLLNKTAFTYDKQGNRTGSTEPLGWKTTFGYDDRANLIAQTNALAEVTLWTFDSFFNKPVAQVTPQPPDELGRTTWTNFYELQPGTGNLLRHYDALGNLVRYTYSTNGLVLTTTDANGNTSTNTYDANGFLIKIDVQDNSTDRTSFISTKFDVNELGWKLTEENALHQLTTFKFDVNGNTLETIDPLSRRFHKTFDPNGNLLGATDGEGRTNKYGYDAANQRTNFTDRAGNKWNYSYTLRGKLETTVAPEPFNYETRIVYDDANRAAKTFYPAVAGVLLSTEVQYDANGNPTVAVDKAGQKWRREFDRLNRVVAEIDPLGNRRRTLYDVAGRLKKTVTANGFDADHFYDGRGRLVRWRDPEALTWVYQYDANANITNIVDALSGNYRMSYGTRNERLTEQNQEGKRWYYEYDALIRLVKETAPNTVQRIIEYDPDANRVSSITFSTGRRDTIPDYDQNDNPKRLVRLSQNQSTTTRLTYDALDRVIQSEDVFRQVLKYGYDSLGRKRSFVYPGERSLTNEFDPLGRLIKQVDWVGRESKYEYDNADRLIRRTYPNGVVQTNSFDTAGRITGLNYTSPSAAPGKINIAMAYAYDRNGNKTGSSERGVLDWTLPAITEEAVSFTPANRVKQREIKISAPAVPTATWAYLYDASGNLTNAVDGKQSYALAYDEDNRTTNIKLGSLAGSTNIVNRFDALGRRVSRTMNGTETRYGLDLSGGMERILFEIDGNENVTAWYVHGPDLSYRAENSSNLLCFHADAQANIIATTDKDAILVHQYAYTPYGRVLAFSGSTLNPFLFVGSHGVMEELPGLYFMRARYYSSETSAFLSTDPVKRIGAGWKSVAYVYAENNSMQFVDARGLSSTMGVYCSGNGYLDGHCWVSLQTGTTTTTYGTWGNKGGYLLENTEVNYHAEASRQYELSDDQTDRFNQIIDEYAAKQQDAWTLLNPCSGFAADITRRTTGEAISDNYFLGLGSPAHLKSEIIARNGGSTVGTSTSPVATGNQSLANKTATVAAPKAQTANATSTKGAMPDNGSSRNNSGGPSSINFNPNANNNASSTPAFNAPTPQKTSAGGGVLEKIGGFISNVWNFFTGGRP